MGNKMTRQQISLRMDPGAYKLAEKQAKELGISKSRYIELVILLASKPELITKWMGMLIGFQEAHTKMMQATKK
jgi:hypothetical protein